MCSNQVEFEIIEFSIVSTICTHFAPKLATTTDTGNETRTMI